MQGFKYCYGDFQRAVFGPPPPFHFKCGYHVYHMDIIGLVAAAPSPLAAAARPRKIVLHISKVVKKTKFC